MTIFTLALLLLLTSGLCFVAGLVTFAFVGDKGNVLLSACRLLATLSLIFGTVAIVAVCAGVLMLLGVGI